MTEKSEAKRDGATLINNSGRGQYRKGDAILYPFTVDYKEYKKGIRIDDKIWGKICMDANRNNDTVPSLKIILGENDNKTRLWLIDDLMFHEMRAAWLKVHGEK